MKKYFISAITLILILASCTNSGKFKIEGAIENAADSTLFIETAINGRWYIVDSVKTNDNGKFDIQIQAPEFPEIYKLTLGENSIYFPIDSIETITINSSVKGFGIDYTLEGSDNAVNMMKYDQLIRKTYLSNNNIAEKDKLKKDLNNAILAAPSSILAYYLINKQIEDKPLYDPAVKMDLNMICAVATSYKTLKPNDPRTDLLERIALSAQQLYRKRSASSQDTLYASLTKLIDIELPDKNGKVQSLNKSASKGKVVILNFTAYSLENSPAINLKLSNIYNANKERIEIYQVGLDSDLSKWKLATQNLPWITVYDEAGIQSKNVAKYNVSAIPMTFIIDKSGTLQERVTDIAKLDSAIKKYL